MTKVNNGKKIIFDKKFIFKGTCFKCGKDEHQVFECPSVKFYKQNLVLQEEHKLESSNVDVASLEVGESLLMRRIMMAKHNFELVKRKNLFKTNLNLEVNVVKLLWMEVVVIILFLKKWLGNLVCKDWYVLLLMVSVGFKMIIGCGLENNVLLISVSNLLRMMFYVI